MIKSHIKNFLCVITFCFSYNLLASQSIKCITYNIRLTTKSDENKGNGWNSRSLPMCNMLKFFDPDIIGCQEMTYEQRFFFQEYFFDYCIIGSDSGDQGSLGDFNAIMFRTNSFELIESGDFWITDKESQWEKGWDAAYIRLCTWAHLKVKGDTIDFFVFNTHLDNKGKIANVEGAKMVRDSVIAISGDKPFVLLGDMNSGHESETYKVFTKNSLFFDTQKIAEFSYVPNGTFNKFSTNWYSTSLIDYIFVSKHIYIYRYGILTNSYWKEDTIKEDETIIKSKAKTYVNCLPSDHYPVMIYASFDKKDY